MKLNRSNKILLTLGSLGVATTIAGAGTFASFTDTETATQQIEAGTVVLTDDTSSFSTAVGLLAPGDTVQRRFSLQNDGSLAFGSVELSVAPSATDLPIFEDTSGPLQVKIDRCAAGWTTGTTLTCAAGAQTVLEETKASGISAAVLANLDLAGDGVDGVDNDLVATYRLPAGADNDVQGSTGSLTFTFTANQRPATNR